MLAALREAALDFDVLYFGVAITITSQKLLSRNKTLSGYYPQRPTLVNNVQKAFVTRMQSLPTGQFYHTEIASQHVHRTGPHHQAAGTLEKATSL